MLAIENPEIKFHHFGIVVENIVDYSINYSEKLGFKIESDIIYEQFQNVFVQFFMKDELRIELIQPADENSPINNFLKNKGFYNHICFEVDSFKNALNFFKNGYKSICVSNGWSGSIIDCKVAFFAKPNGEIIELIKPYNGLKYFEGYKI